MPATFTYPGIYVTEKPSGAQAVPAAPTSIAMFIGMADKGPFNIPTRVQGLARYTRTFGDTSTGEMADQVRQFFVNGGGDAYIMRIADGAAKASVLIQNEAGHDVLLITARDEGIAGNLIRVEVDYATKSPERTFNLTAYRLVQLPNGDFARTDEETISNLSMNPDDARFVETAVENASVLIRVESQVGAPSVEGVSLSGLILPADADAAKAAIVVEMKKGGTAFQVSVNGRPPMTATILAGADSAILTRIRKAIIDAYAPVLNLAGPGALTVTTETPAAPNNGLGRILQIQSKAGAIVISPAGANDCAVALMLGADQGGMEFDVHSPNRPAPSGVFSALGEMIGSPDIKWMERLLRLAAAKREDLKRFKVDDPGAPATPHSGVALVGTAADPIAYNAAPTPALGSLTHVREALNTLAEEMNKKFAAQSPRRWTAQRQGSRLVLRASPKLGASIGSGVTVITDNGTPGAGFNIGGVGEMMAATFSNVAAYNLGSPGGLGFQSPGTAGIDGNKPALSDYNAAFDVIDRQVEIFNLMVLPRAEGQSDTDRAAIRGAASAYCAKARAILFVDPNDAWKDIDKADSGADAIKVGIETRNAIVYWPRLKVPTADIPKGKVVDPSGSMAGLYARTDTRFGVWRAPAGLDSTLTGVVGLETLMSDDDNGRINIKALNALRLFPSGITSWGARTMVGANDTGNVDDKYINVRRTMLFIENSLYRGLRFAVFKNNAEPLWASIRLAAGSFMNGLMLQGAFASDTKSKAYYVLCDETTTTPDDINLGIVNVLVGFAPNKPAEFVHLTVTQIAGQTQV